MNVRQLVDKYQANCDRIGEIADLCEKEQRERTAGETAEFESLTRENQLIQMRLQAAAADHLKENPDARKDAMKLIRENAANNRKSEIVFVRDVMMVSDVSSGAIIPLNIQDILKPLTEGFILDKVGLPMPTGLAGDYVWPVYEMVSAQVAGEGVALGDTKIPFSKLTAQPERIGIAVPVTNQSLTQTDGLLETIVREIMPQSIRLLLNKILFSTAKVNGATHLEGPFVGKKATAVGLSNVPTFKQLNAQMKAAVLETGIDGEHLCWIMSKSMQAILEGTPVSEKGIYVPMIQNGYLCGLPVYTTNEIREKTVSYHKYTSSAWGAHELDEGETAKYKVSSDSEDGALEKITSPAEGDIAEVTVYTEYIGIGDWRYQPMGLFGSMRFIVDPYSKARNDSVDFVLNVDYGTKCLRPEAFLLGKVAPSE